MQSAVWRITDWRDWRTQLVWIAFFALSSALLFQGNRGLWGSDEGRYSNVALQMLESGQWLTPHRHPDHIEYSKPPMTYWAMALSIKLFGHQEWAIRLPSALSFFGTTLLCFLIARHLHAKRAWLAPVMYGTNAVPFLAANYAGADGLLTLFVTLGMYSFVCLWHSEQADVARNYRRLMWASFALAFLCKGPAALLPLLALLLYRRFSGLRFPCSSIGFDGPILFLLISAPWFVWMFGLGEAAGIVEGNQAWSAIRGSYKTLITPEQVQPWYGGVEVYGPVILLGLLPWGLLALVLAVTQYRGAVAAYFSKLKMRRFRQLHQESVFLLTWFLVPLIVLLAVQVRVYLFMLPMLVAQALIIARALQYVPIKRWMAVALFAWLFGLLAVKGFLPHHTPHTDAAEIAAQLRVDGINFEGQSIAVFESTPRYGLKFYLGVNLLRVADTGARDASFDLLSADALKNKTEFWMVENERVIQFHAMLAREGFVPSALSQSEEYRLFRVSKRP
jgi:4-amino-4-deoxy-L-arabinose transferase-like glycosyltransferase